MTPRELIDRYDIFLSKIHPGKITVGNSELLIDENAEDEVRSRKEEIVAVLNAEQEQKQKEWEARKAKIAAIPGLKEIENARTDLSRWHREFNKSFDGEYACGGMGVRPKPKYDLEDMYKKYPIAKAYLMADAYEDKSNYELSEIGKRAKEAIINNPENYEEIIAKMQTEITEFTDRHLFD